MTTADISLIAFAACNALRIAAYFPQMFKLAQSSGAARSFCFTTWTLFAAANASTAVYAAVVLDDVVLGYVNALSALCCGVLMGLAWWRCRHPEGLARSSFR